MRTVLASMSLLLLFLVAASGEEVCNAKNLAACDAVSLLQLTQKTSSRRALEAQLLSPDPLGAAIAAATAPTNATPAAIPPAVANATPAAVPPAAAVAPPVANATPAAVPVTDSSNLQANVAQGVVDGVQTGVQQGIESIPDVAQAIAMETVQDVVKEQITGMLQAKIVQSLGGGVAPLNATAANVTALNATVANVTVVPNMSVAAVNASANAAASGNVTAAAAIMAAAAAGDPNAAAAVAAAEGTTGLEKTTALAAPVDAGSMVLPVSSVDGYEAGQTITITDATTGEQQTATIAGFTNDGGAISTAGLLQIGTQRSRRTPGIVLSTPVAKTVSSATITQAVTSNTLGVSSNGMPCAGTTVAPVPCSTSTTTWFSPCNTTITMPCITTFTTTMGIFPCISTSTTVNYYTTTDPCAPTTTQIDNISIWIDYDTMAAPGVIAPPPGDPTIGADDNLPNLTIVILPPTNPPNPCATSPGPPLR